MGRLAYTIAGTAKAVGTSERIIIEAVKAGHLIARRVDDKAVILGADIQAWLASLPSYLTVQ